MIIKLSFSFTMFVNTVVLLYIRKRIFFQIKMSYDKTYLIIIIIIIPRPCKGIEKTVEHAGDNYSNCNWCVWNSN